MELCVRGSLPDRVRSEPRSSWIYQVGAKFSGAGIELYFC